MVADINERYGPNPLNIMVHNNDYTAHMRLTGYIDVEFNEEFGFNAGTGTITIPADHPLANRLMQAHMDVVPITAEYNGWYWTGRVDSYVASGKPGRETITLTLIDDKIQLANILAFASPNMSLNVQKKRDHQKGPLQNVVYHYISRNLPRSSVPVYLIMPPTMDRDNSVIIDVAARMTSLDALLKDALNQHDYDLYCKMWWPGQPFPEGKIVPLVRGDETLRGRILRWADLDQVFNPWSKPIAGPSVPGLVIAVRPAVKREHVRFSTRAGEIDEFKLSGKSPGAARAVVGGKSDDIVNEALNFGIDLAIQGILTAIGGIALGPIGAALGGAAGNFISNQVEDTLFAFVDRKDVERAAEMGPFHLRESFTQSTAGAFTFDTQALAERALLEAKGGQSVEITMGHSVSKTLGNDQIAKNGKVRYGFKVGDRVTFEEHLSGVVVSDIITGITVKDSREERMRISPRIGKRKNVSNPYLDFTDKLSKGLDTIRDLGLAG
ncbi:Gp37-like protein [Corynebacterium striatum]